MIKKIKAAFFQWADSRIPSQGITSLQQRNIYILPTRYGWLMLVIMILVLIAATNYQNNMGFMSGFVILALGMLSTFYTYRNVQGLEINVLQPRSVFVGEKIVFPVEINNNTEQYRSTVGIGTSKSSVIYLDIAEQDKTTKGVEFNATQRGYFTPSRFVCLSIFPFGIFQVWSWFKTERKALIYPKPIAAPFPIAHSTIANDEGVQAIKGSEDFYSVKEYKQGDSLKQVVWKAYARGRGLLSKEFEEKVGRQHYFSWSSVAHYDKELAISYLTYEIVMANKSGYEYGLELPKKVINLGQGSLHMNKCLKALALL